MGVNAITLGTATGDGEGVTGTLKASAASITLEDVKAGNLDLEAGAGIINQLKDTAVTVAGATTLKAAGQDITLSNASNDFNTVSVTSANNVTLTDKNAIMLGSVNANSLDITASAGSITQSNATALTITNATTLKAVGQNITLNNTGNDFNTVSVTSGKDVTLTDKNALVLGNVNAESLDVTASAGTITQSNATALSITGATTLKAVGQDITLNNADNDFNTVSITSGKDVTLTDQNAIVLDNVTVHSLDVTASTGTITQSKDGALSITGTSTLSTSNQDITLSNSANDFGDTVKVQGDQINLAAKNSISLDGNSAITSNLTINTKGSITHTNKLSVGGDTSLTADNSVTLGSTDLKGTLTIVAGKDITGTDILVAGKTSLTAGDHVTLQNTTIQDDLSIAALNDYGTITSNGNLSVKGHAALLSTDEHNSITLKGNTTAGSLELETGSSFYIDGQITVDGTTKLTSSNIANLAAHAVFKGDLNVSGEEGIVNTGEIIDVSGMANLSSGSAIQLGNLTIRNGGEIKAETITVDGALNLKAGTLNLIASGSGSSGSNLKTINGQNAILDSNLLYEATKVISQTTQGKITTDTGTALQLLATAGGSIDLAPTDKDGAYLSKNGTFVNQINGKISAETGLDIMLGGNPTVAITPGNEQFKNNYQSIGVVKIHADHLDVAPSTLKTFSKSGLVGDVIELRTNKVVTGDGSVIRARLPYRVGTDSVATALPALTFDFKGISNLQNGNFGASGTAWLNVLLGESTGSFVTSFAPGTYQEGGGFAIFLGGPDGVNLSDRTNKIPIFYNGEMPQTAAEVSALSALLATIEEARRARFEEVVRTENVSARLRSGVIAEVGPGKPATESNEPPNRPADCTPGADLSCSQ